MTSRSSRGTSGSSNNGAMMSSNKMPASNSSTYGAVLRPLTGLLLIKLQVRSQEKANLHNIPCCCPSSLLRIM
ncbi:MAG: hypothetical protein M3P08_15490 [Thermoproteota archaeon]|nr:hypothetical protein [Thermoproteota archaeon]